MAFGAGDWSAAPAATDVGEFGNTPQASTLANMTLGYTLTLGGLQFDANMNGPLTITDANTLTLGSSGITNMLAATRNVTMSNPVTLGAAQTWLVNPGQTLTVSGPVTGNYLLTVAGGGTVNLNNNTTPTNNYGATFVNGGTLDFNSLIFPNASASSYFIQNGGTVVGGSILTIIGGNGPFIAITNGANFTASSVIMLRTYNSLTTTPTDTSPIPGRTTDGFYVNGANTSVTLGFLGISSLGANASSTARIDGGNVNVTGTVSLADATGGAHYSVLQVNGGTFNVGDTTTGISVAKNSLPTTSRTWGELYFSGGTSTVGAISFGGPNDATGTSPSVGWVLVGGGNLYMGSGGIVNASASSTYQLTFHLYSGLLGAKANWSSSVPLGVTGPAGTPFIIQAADTNGTAHNITLTGGLYGAGPLTKIGNGTLTLGGTNTYSGSLVVSNGTLAIGSGGSLAATNITLVPGTLLDTTASGLALGISQTIVGGRTASPATDINGNLTSSGTINVAGTGTPGTLTLNGNLTLSAGTVVFDLSTNASGVNTTNDKVVLTGSGTLNCGSGSVSVNYNGTLDTNTDYVLFSASSVIGSLIPIPNWVGGTPPPVSGYFSVKTIGSTVVLHYNTGTPATASSVSVNPASAVRNQNIAFSVTGVPGAGASTISSISINLSAISGAAGLALVDTGNHLTFTNTVSISPSDTFFGLVSLPVSIVDNSGGVGATNISLTVTGPTVATWTGGNGNNWSTNPNWVSTYAPGYIGDSLIFTGNNNTPVMDNSYTIGGVTFNNLASSFTLTNSGGNTLTLTGGVTNNSANAQTLNLPVLLGAPVTVNAALGNIALNGVVSGASSLTVTGLVTSSLTLSGSNTFTGGVNLNAGVVALNAPETLLVSGPLGQNGSILFGGGTMQYSAVNANDYSARFSTAATNLYSIDVAGRTVSFATALTSGGGSLKLADSVGGGTLTLTKATSTFTGNVNVNGGTLVTSAGAANAPTTTALGAQSSARTIYVNSGATLTLSVNNIFGNIPTSNIPRIVINNGTLNTALYNSFATSSNGTSGLILTNGAVLNTTGASPTPYNAGNFGDLVVVGGTSGSTITGSYPMDLWSGNSTGTSLTGGSTTFNVASTGVGPDLIVSVPLADNGWSGTAVKAGLIKTGNGIMQLATANTYSGNTLVNAGTLAMAGGSIISTNITITSGAIFDTTAAGGYTINLGQTIVAGHTNTPTATDINGGLAVGGTLYVAGSGTIGTLTVSNGDLTFSSSGTLQLDLSSTVGGANDKVVVNGNLDGGGTAINISCPSGLAAADYVLVNASGSIGSFNPAPFWIGTPPAGSYAVKTVGQTVVLHYQTPGTAPTATSATSTPASVQLNNVPTFSVTGVPGTGASTISSITVNLSSIGGSPNQALTDSGDHHTFSAPVTIPGNDTLFGPVSLPVTIVDSNGGVGTTNIALGIYLPPTVTAQALPSGSVYSGQNVRLNGVIGGTAVGLQWQSSPDYGTTWNNIPGATTNNLVINPFVVNTLTYQLVVTNAIGTNSSGSIYVTYNALPTTPAGLWTANFQFTNNVLKGSVSTAGIGHYIGRGILGTGFYWNIMPAVVANLTTPLAINSVSDLLDDGVTHSGIYCYISNSIPNSSDSPALSSFSSDIWSLLDQYQTYTNLSAPLPMIFKGVPNGTYNLVVYAAIGQYSDRGTTIVVNDPQNGNQTQSTLNAPPQIALSQGNNFVLFTNVHVSGGTLVLNLSPNLSASNVAVPELDVNGAQLQLVSYDTPAPVVTLGQAYSKANNTMTLTWPQGDLLTTTNLLGPWTTNYVPSPLTVQTTNAAQFFRVWVPLHP